MSRTAVRFFVSYARSDESSADDLLARLRLQMAPSATYEFRFWQDRAILVGEDWDDEIHAALDGCDLGLLLVSPALLGSDYVAREELPRFVGGVGKPAVPVELEPVSFDHHDLKGLDRLQIFRLDRRKAFGQCRGNAEKNRFVEQLYDQIESRLRRLAAVGA